MSSTKKDLFEEAMSLFEQGDPSRAKILLAEVLQKNLANDNVKFAIRCADFWNEPVSSLESLPTGFDRGQLLLGRWEVFQNDFLAERGFVSTQVLHFVRRGIFLLALKEFSSATDEKKPRQKAEILRRIGLCRKRLGDYEGALEALKDANALLKSVLQETFAEMVAELADCYALVGDENTAKLLFREAFFIDAQKVETKWLDSELVRRIIAVVSGKGYKGAALKEWIPVYGTLYGIFSVRRDLRSTEAGQLKQKIYTRETELKNPSNDESLLVPNLINLYFWLMDYYSGISGGDEKINEIMLKIKLLSPEIHALCSK